MRLELHLHRCGLCGTVWQHPDTMAGDFAAHQCPNCPEMFSFTRHELEPGESIDFPWLDNSSWRRSKARRRLFSAVVVSLVLTFLLQGIAIFKQLGFPREGGPRPAPRSYSPVKQLEPLREQDLWCGVSRGLRA
jgi:hypothetical protein